MKTRAPPEEQSESASGEDSYSCFTLLVIYTEALDECLHFYVSLGLTFVPERHGSGALHYAAALPGGVVFELYPATEDRVTTRALRLGFTVKVNGLHTSLPPGRHVREDPDGRTVEVRVMS